MPQHTDYAGVMWHGQYVSFLEEARIDALEMVGLSYSELTLQKLEMPVVRLEIKYLKSIMHGQNIFLESYCLPRKGVKWPWQTSFICSGMKVAEASVDLVLIKVDDSGSKILRKVPEKLNNALLKLQYGSFEQVSSQ